MRKLILMGMPNHGNIGDSAIFHAENVFIKENLSEFEYYVVPERHLDKCIEKVKNFCNDDDIICFHGGGNIGDQYKVENFRRKVITLLPNNKIILFPQTIHFSNTEYGKKDLELSEKVYANHKNLVIFTREKVSYEFAKEHFKNNKVFLTPDIVTYLNETVESPHRSGLLYLLRNDVERSINDEQKQQIDDIVKKYFSKIKNSDIARVERINVNRLGVINNKLAEIRSAEMVITDRLHGMIFCAITSTPCIAISNYNHKVSSSSEWFKNLGYIKFVNNISEIDEKIKELKQEKLYQYDNMDYKEKLKQIINEIK